MARDKGRPAYSTGPGGALPAGYEACRRCGSWPCRCEPQQSLPPQRQAVRVRREKAGRGGKTVTTIAPMLLTREDASALLGELKRLCGGGGALKTDRGPDGPFFVLEVQGDHADKVVATLVSKGYPAKRAGG
jgi:translation initiation factor 1